jgi:glycine cleavage system T protein
MIASTLPSHASVIVIGGGIMGCSTLYHLTKLGVADAILVERNKLTSGTTWHSAAQVRALRSSRGLTELVRYSVSLYAELEAETGQATGWIQKGSLSIATTPDRLIHIRRQEALAHTFGVPAYSISPHEAKERWPLMNASDVIGAVWSPDDGRVNPSDLCAGLVKGARKRGASIFEDTAVTGVMTNGDRIAGIETTRGPVRCEAIALCTGLWSRRVGAMAGASVPVWPCEHFYLLTRPVPGAERPMPTLSDHDGHLYIRDESQGLLVGCFEPSARPIDPGTLGEDFAFQLLPEDWDHFEPIMHSALHRLPVLETAQVRMLLNGPEGFTPDGTFLLGETAETRGLFLGCGMNSIGVASGGGAGMALAHRIVRGYMPADLTEADAKRFPDCLNSIEALTARAPEVLGKHYEIAYPGRQWNSARNLRQSPFYERWTEMNARFGQFYGWERPLYFGSEADPVLTFGKPSWFDQVGREVAQTHKHASVFDQSTFGKIRVAGADAEKFLNRVCANDMARAPGRAVYTAMLNAQGGFESDLIALRLSDEVYKLYVGTIAIKRDLAWLRRHLEPGDRVALSDETETYAVLALMGPDAKRIVRALQANAIDQLGYFHHCEDLIAGVPVHAVRLSYVGEPGWELTCRTGDAQRLYDTLYEAGSRPGGLYAQTSMRIEKRYLAMGNDLDGDVSPLEAGLELTVAWHKPFIGREALLRRREAGITSRLVSIVLDDEKAVPLGMEPVCFRNEIIGKVTSAAFGYRVGRPVALAYLGTSHVGDIEGLRVELNIAGQSFPGTASLSAAYDPNGVRLRNPTRTIVTGAANK